MTCPLCGAEVPKGGKFCSVCGTRMPDCDRLHGTPTQELRAVASGLATGTAFAGRYQVIEELGKGGMGLVYKVLDLKIKETVALKLIKPELAADPRTIDRFSNELRLARKVRHKNVCAMYELDDAEGHHYFTMEYVQGEDLKRILGRSADLPLATVLRISIQVCEGLAEAHGLGIIHRDLKPQNIMLDKGGNAKIMDFGIARALQEKGITAAGMMVGTPEYMSPEQAEGQQVDPRSDMYSFGILLYEMVAGRLPFEGETPFSVALKHRSEAPPSPRAFNPRIPAGLERLILRCLEKDKARRYPTMEGLLADLRAVEEEISAAENATAKRPLPLPGVVFTRRLKKALGIALAATAVLMLGVFLYVIFSKKSSVLPFSDGPPQAASPERSAFPQGNWSNSVAVLPFDDLSPGKEQAHLCDGMTEDIIGQLSRIGDLKVISRSSVVFFKGTQKPVKTIARELGVANILEGSIQREGEAIRINARLVDAESGFQIWSAKYDRMLAGVFAIQDEISQAIADSLQVKLTRDLPGALKASRPGNMKLYETYLQGMYYINSRYVLTYQEEDFGKAMRKFEEARAMDPRYAKTHVGMAWAYWHKYAVAGEEEDLQRCVSYGEKGYELGPELADAKLAKGFIHFLKGEYDEAFRKYRDALEQNPNSHAICMGIGFSCEVIGLHEKAIPYLQKAVELAPFYIFSRSILALCHQGLGEFEKAEAHLREALSLNPRNPFCLGRLTQHLILAGRCKEAEGTLAELERLSPGYSYLPKFKAQIFAVRGEKEKALALSRHSSVFSLLAMKNEAIRALANESAEGWPEPYLNLIHNPLYKNLREDPRFSQFVARAKTLHEGFLRKFGDSI